MIKTRNLCETQLLLEKIYACYRFNPSLQFYALKDLTLQEINQLDMLLIEFNEHNSEVYLENALEKNIPVIVIFHEMTMENMECILHYNIQMYAFIHSSVLEIYALFRRIMHKHPAISQNKSEQIEQLLTESHYPVHLFGSVYMKTILLYCIENQITLLKMKDCYEMAAMRHQTTVSRVEKSLRKAVSDSQSEQNLPHISNAQAVSLLIHQLERRGI